MVKRFLDLLLPQKKLFFYAILSSIIMTVLGIASSMFNKILMDEILPYGLKSLLISMILVFSLVSVTSASSAWCGSGCSSICPSRSTSR